MLQDPQQAIPRGTLLAILITGIVYLGVAVSTGRVFILFFILFVCFSKKNSRVELNDNKLIVCQAPVWWEMPVEMWTTPSAPRSKWTALKLPAILATTSPPVLMTKMAALLDSITTFRYIALFYCNELCCWPLKNISVKILASPNAFVV